MASDHRTAPDLVALMEALQREPFRFDFFRTLRRFEALHSGRPRLGTSTKAADEPVRLGQDPSTSFAPSTIADFEPRPEGRPPRMLVYFLGLLGPHGPLPLHLTEYARDRSRNAQDPTFSRFLDLFNHRLLTLFYRAWAQTQPTVSFDRPETDRFGVYLASLFGDGLSTYRDRDAMTDLAKLHFTGHLSCQTRHPEGMRSILGDFLKLPVAIEEMVGHWLELPPDCRWRLGEGPRTGRLGVNTTVGARVWDKQYKFRVRIGPLNLSEFERLLPGSDTLPRVVAVVRNYVGDQLRWDLNPVLRKADVPLTQLGAKSRLGWTTWLTSKPLSRDGDELLLDAMAWENGQG